MEIRERNLKYGCTYVQSKERVVKRKSVCVRERERDIIRRCFEQEREGNGKWVGVVKERVETFGKGRVYKQKNKNRSESGRQIYLYVRHTLPIICGKSRRRRVRWTE